jgi:CRISPR-associated protein Csb2
MEAPPERLKALRALARDTSYIGHSSSLVRCIFLSDSPSPAVALRLSNVVRALYSGRLRELEALYARHIANADANARPRPAPPIQPQPLSARQRLTSIFGEHWIVLEFDAGNRPELRATTVIGRAMRDALMSAWGSDIPRWLSGHNGDGTPTREPHMAVIPLANVGYPWSDGIWHGLAVVLPRSLEDAWLGAATPEAFANRQRLLGLFRVLAAPSGESGTVQLRLGALGVIQLRLLDAPDQHRLRSLQPRRYMGQRHRWCTVTPIALDRHPKGAEQQLQAAEIVAQCCVRIGLPRPANVLVHKHSAIIGAPSAWPAGGAPRWAGWTRPESLAGRPLIHATLQFQQPVQGPIMLGAGRFFGLGLCLPVGRGDGS